MKDLVERVEAELMRQYQANQQWDEAKDVVEGFDAKALARAVLSHFSEPGNVTEAMALQSWVRLPLNPRYQETTAKSLIASAMRAALSELQAKEAGE